MAAKHILIAQGKAQDSDGRSGPRAGFDAYMAGQSPLARATQDEIRKAGNKKARFNAYCAKFGSQWENGVNTSARIVHDDEEKLSIIERLAAKVGLSVQAPVGIEVVEDEEEPELSDMERLIALAAEAGVTLVATPDTTAPKAQKPAPAPTTEKWAPKNPNELCSKGRLWRLNEAGLLTTRKTAGPTIKSGEAHHILSALNA